ncbi:MAG: glycosyltransferase [Gemmataceae bacterium]|nr:glycosyltransferase [Gemmataceae bacterium]
MRILFVAPAYKAFRLRGAVLIVSALAETLARQGHDVTVFATNTNSDEYVDEDLPVPLDCPLMVNGVRVWYFRRTDTIKRCLSFIPYLARSVGWLYAPRMRAALRRLVPEVDLVHTHMPFVYPTYAAAQVAWQLRKPLFYHQHGVFDPLHLKFRSLKKDLYIAGIEQPILRRANTLIAGAEGEVASYRALGVRTPCRLVPNGIDPGCFRRVPRPETDARWRIPPGAQVVLFLGRLYSLKGADRLIEAFLKMANRCPRAVLIMAGPDYGGLERQYREAIQSAGLGERVRFPGTVLGEEKLDLLARADVFCLPSLSEGFSMAVLEALASATPVLLSPGCYFPEVEAAEAGRIVPVQAEAIAGALADLLARPQQLPAMGQAGLELVRRHYSWEHVAERLAAVYEEGIARHLAVGRPA